MKFIEKERTIEQRETLALIFWFFMMSLGTILFVCLIEALCNIVVLLSILLLVIFIIWRKNNILTIEQVKKERDK